MHLLRHLLFTSSTLSRRSVPGIRIISCRCMLACTMSYSLTPGYAAVRPWQTVFQRWSIGSMCVCGLLLPAYCVRCYRYCCCGTANRTLHRHRAALHFFIAVTFATVVVCLGMAIVAAVIELLVLKHLSACMHTCSCHVKKAEKKKERVRILHLLLAQRGKINSTQQKAY